MSFLKETRFTKVTKIEVGPRGQHPKPDERQAKREGIEGGTRGENLEGKEGRATDETLIRIKCCSCRNQERQNQILDGAPCARAGETVLFRNRDRAGRAACYCQAIIELP